jgi:membrane protease YdiL (CAAX protease family)
MKIALLVTAVVAAAVGFSLREAVAATPVMWLGLFIPYLVLAAFALRRFREDGTLGDQLRFRAGDFTLGFVLAAVIFGGAWVVKRTLLGESPKMVWLFHLALEVGGPKPSLGLLATIAGLAVLEEIVWRGLVLGALTESLGSRRSWPLAAVFYALAHLPTALTLGDPAAGPNPLLVVAALGAGLVWSFAASLLGRLIPLFISHAVFSYFAVTVLLPRFG